MLLDLLKALIYKYFKAHITTFIDYLTTWMFDVVLLQHLLM